MADHVSQYSILGQQLLSASRDGDLVGVKVCLANGVNVEIRHPLNLQPLTPQEQDPSSKGEAFKPCGFTPLMYAAQNGHIKIVNALLEERADCNAQDEDGTTSMHLAAASVEFDVLDALLKAGARTDVADDDGNSILDYLPEDISVSEVQKWKAKVEGISASEVENWEEKIEA